MKTVVLLALFATVATVTQAQGTYSEAGERPVVRYVGYGTQAATPLLPGTYCVYNRGLNGTNGNFRGIVYVSAFAGRGSLINSNALRVQFDEVGVAAPQYSQFLRTTDLPFENAATGLGGIAGVRRDIASQYRHPGSDHFPVVAFVQNFDNQGQVIGYDAYYAKYENVPKSNRIKSQTWINKILVGACPSTY